MSDARPMEPSDAHEIMRRVVEADELDMNAIGRDLRVLEAQRDHVVALAADSDRFEAIAAEWEDAYANARRYVEQTLERRGKLGAVVVDFAIHQVAVAERDHKVELRLASLERQLSRGARAGATRIRADASVAGRLATMGQRAIQEAEPHPSHRTLLNAEDFDRVMHLYGQPSEEDPGEGWVWCPRTRRAAHALHFSGNH